MIRTQNLEEKDSVGEKTDDSRVVTTILKLLRSQYRRFDNHMLRIHNHPGFSDKFRGIIVGGLLLVE